jgi:hypothetical protein
MRLKLDLHPIYNDSRSIEASLQGIIDEAIAKRAKEVEIIPGKGSGALKKSVIRFLQRPEIRSRYHRLEKDSDNWGRLFIHFRRSAEETESGSKPALTGTLLSVPCACCRGSLDVRVPEEENAGEARATCPGCGSPNRVMFRRDRRGRTFVDAELNYDSE